MLRRCREPGPAPQGRRAPRLVSGARGHSGRFGSPALYSCCSQPFYLQSREALCGHLIHEEIFSSSFLCPFISSSLVFQLKAVFVIAVCCQRKFYLKTQGRACEDRPSPRGRGVQRAGPTAPLLSISLKELKSASGTGPPGLDMSAPQSRVEEPGPGGP